MAFVAGQDLSAFPDAGITGGKKGSPKATWCKLMSQLSQTCNTSDMHAAIRVALTEPLDIDQSACLKGKGGGLPSSSSSAAATPISSLSPEKMAKIQQAIMRANAMRELIPEHVDSRALQPALKMIGTIERDPVLSNALLSLPLIKESKPLSSSSFSSSTGGGGRGKGSGGGGGKRRGSKSKGGGGGGRFNLPEQICHIIAVGLANRSLQTFLLGFKALLCLYESALEEGCFAPDLPGLGPLLAGLTHVRLMEWQDCLSILEKEEETERTARVTGYPRLEICSGQPASLQALEVAGPVTAVVRSIRVKGTQGRAYYEATITSAAAASSSSSSAVRGGGASSGGGGGKPRGIRIGWAAAGSMLSGQLGDATASLGFDGCTHRVYSQAKKRLADFKKEEAEADAKEWSSSNSTSTGAGAGGGEGGSETNEGKAGPGVDDSNQPLSPPLVPPETIPQPPSRHVSTRSDDSFDILGLNGLFAEEEEEGLPDGGRDLGRGLEGSTSGSGTATAAAQEAWKLGDTIGCLIDLEAKTMAFHVNGIVQGETPFLDFEPDAKEGICPGVSMLRPGYAVQINLGQDQPFKYEPFFRTSSGTLVIKSARKGSMDVVTPTSSSSTPSIVFPPPIPNGSSVLSPSMTTSTSFAATSYTPSSSSSRRKASQGGITLSASGSTTSATGTGNITTKGTTTPPYCDPVSKRIVSPCLELKGAGQLEIPFGRPLRLQQGATMEILVKASRLPEGEGSSKSSYFLIGSADFGIIVQRDGSLGFHNSTGTPTPKLISTAEARADAGSSSSSSTTGGSFRMMPGAWTQLTLTMAYDTNTMNLYADGEIVAKASSSNLQRMIQNLGKVAFVGGRPIDGGEMGGGEIVDGLWGSVAEVRLWSTTRNPKQVLATQARWALRGDEEGLVGWWRIDQGSGHAIQDARLVRGQPTSSNIALLMGEAQWGSCFDEDSGSSSKEDEEGGGAEESKTAVATEASSETGGGREEEQEEESSSAAAKEKNVAEVQAMITQAVQTLIHSLPGSLGGSLSSLLTSSSSSSSASPAPSSTIPWALLALLGQLSQLCNTYVDTAPDPSSPSTLQELRRMDNHGLGLVAHPHFLTFLLLTSLLRHLSRLLNQPYSRQPPASAQVGLSQPYAVLPLALGGVLRLLRTNLYHLKALQMGPGSVGLGVSTRPDDRSKPFIYRLLDVLFGCLATSNEEALPVEGSDEAAPRSDILKGVQAEVAALIGTGLEVFFPDQSRRHALLVELLRSSSSTSGNSGEDDAATSATPQQPPSSPFPSVFSVDQEAAEIEGERFLPPISPFARQALLTNVCRALVSSLPTALQFIPHHLRVLPAIPTLKGNGTPLAFINESLVPVRPPSSRASLGGPPSDLLFRVGTIVVRGPHWRWGDQDGGQGQRGLVVGIDDWGSSPSGRGRKVRVVWPNGSWNVYRWRLRGEQGQIISDIWPADAASDSFTAGFGGATGGDSSGLLSPRVRLSLDVVRRTLLPSSVSSETSRGGTTPTPTSAPGGGPITKRVVLRYMREVAPSVWLAERGLLVASENALVRDMTGEAVVRIYEEFVNMFGEDSGGIEMSDSGTIINSPSTGQGAILPEDIAIKEQVKMHELLTLLLAHSHQQHQPPPPAEVMYLIGLLQSILFGVLRAPRDRKEIANVDIPRILSSFASSLHVPTSKEFRGESGVSRKWDWLEGTYERVGGGGDGGSRSISGGMDGSGHPQDGGGPRTTRLIHLKINRSRCHTSMAIQDGGLSLMQGPDKGWGVALSRYGFARGSGTHRWIVRLDRVNRRGHVFLGVARRSVGLASFLGNDATGWGYLQSQDLYHGGSRKRSQYGEKLSQGARVELVLDSDQGTLSIGNADRGTSFGVAFTDLYAGAPSSGPDSLIYPAFSLHHTGDLISLVAFDGIPANADGGLGLDEGEDEEEEEMDRSGRTTGLGGSIGGSLVDPMASPTLASSVILGSPASALLNYIKTLLETAANILSPLMTLQDDDPSTPSASQVKEAIDHPVIAILVPMALLALYRWQHFAPLDDLTKDLCVQARKLLQALEASHCHAQILVARQRRASLGQESDLMEDQEYLTTRGRLSLITRLELYVSIFLGRVVGTDFDGPLETCSNEVRAHVEEQMLPMLQQGGSAPPSTPSTASGGEKKEKEGGEEALQSRWIQSPLFAHGLLDSNAISQPSALLNNRSLEDCLHMMMEGDEVCPWLERWLARHVPQAPALARLGGPGLTRAVRACLVALLYHAGALQATLRLATALMEACTSGDAAKAAAFESRLPPSFLLEAWRRATGLRFWARSRVDGGVSYESSSHALITRARFLLELTPAMEYDIHAICDALVDAVVEGAEEGGGEGGAITPGSSGGGASVGERGLSHPPHHHHHHHHSSSLELGRGWSSSSFGGGPGRPQMSTFCSKRQTDVLTSTLSFLKESNGMDLIGLRTRQLTSLARAQGRERALRLMLSMLQGEGSTTADRTAGGGIESSIGKAVALLHLTAAMRQCLSTLSTYVYRTTRSDGRAEVALNPSPFAGSNKKDKIGASLTKKKELPFLGTIHARHYLEGLEGCGAKSRKAVAHAFEALGALAASELTRQEGSPSELVLLDWWGMIIRVEDHDLLARVRLFNVLQETLKAAAEGEHGIYEPGLAHLITRATMTLVYLLAMQVAMADGEKQLENESSADASAGVGGPEAPPPLIRIRSGPATLSDSVFRMLHVELQGILSGLDPMSTTTSDEEEENETKEDSSARRALVKPEEVQVLLSEVTTLLLYVCDTPVCRRILSKPAWVALLLELTRVGPTSAQQRGLRLLRSLLPWCPPEVLQLAREPLMMRIIKDVVGSGSMVSSDDPSAAPKALVLFLMDLIGRPYDGSPSSSCLTTSSSGPASRQLEKLTIKSAPEAIPLSTLALSQEALALLITLLPTGGPWAEVTQAIIEQALEGLTVIRSLLASDDDEESSSMTTIDGTQLENLVLDDQETGEIRKTFKLGLAALAVLGGAPSFLYPGGRVEVGDGRGRRPGLVIRIDFARDEAEVKRIQDHKVGNNNNVGEGAAAGTSSGSDLAAVGGGGGGAASASAAAAPASVALNNEGEEEIRVVKVDALRPVPGVALRSMDIPEKLKIGVFEALGQWAFLNVSEDVRPRDIDESARLDKSDDDDQDEIKRDEQQHHRTPSKPKSKKKKKKKEGGGEADKRGGGGFADEKEEGIAGDDDTDEDEEKKEVITCVWDLALLIRSLQCQTLRAAHTLTLDGPPGVPLESLLSSSSTTASMIGGRKDLLRDLLRLSARRTEAAGLADVAIYEELMQLLLVYRQLVPSIEKNAKQDKRAAAEKAKKEADAAKAAAAMSMSMSASSTGTTTSSTARTPSGGGGGQVGEAPSSTSSLPVQPARGEETSAPTPASARREPPSIHPLVASLVEMGFPVLWCQRALEEVGGDHVEDALNWILANGEILAMEDSAREEEEEEEAAQAAAAAAAAEAEAEAQQQQGESGAGGGEEEKTEPATGTAATTTVATGTSTEGVEGRDVGVESADATTTSIGGGEVWTSPAASSTWPRVYHVDPRSGAYLTLHSEPSLESERVGTIFGGDEVMAVAEEGDWLQVKTDHVRDEDKEDDEEDDEDDEDDEEDEVEDDEDDEEEEEEEDENSLSWVLCRTSDGRVVVLPGPSPVEASRPPRRAGGSRTDPSAPTPHSEQAIMAREELLLSALMDRRSAVGGSSNRDAAISSGLRMMMMQQEDETNRMISNGGGGELNWVNIAQGVVRGGPSSNASSSSSTGRRGVGSGGASWYRHAHPGGDGGDGGGGRGPISRRGLDLSSSSTSALPPIADLEPGREVMVVQEALDSRGSLRIRLNRGPGLPRPPSSATSSSSQPHQRKWTGKRPGLLGRIGRPLTHEGEEDDKGEDEEEDDLAIVELEDALEEEVGQELFRRDDRYFPGKGGRHIIQQRRCEAGLPPATRAGRRLRAFGQDTVQGAWRSVISQTKTSREVASRLHRSLVTLQSLHARQLSLAILLLWRESLVGEDYYHPSLTPLLKGPKDQEVVVEQKEEKEEAEQQDQSSGRSGAVAADLESLLRLLTFRGLSEAAWESRFTRIAVGGNEGEKAMVPSTAAAAAFAAAAAAGGMELPVTVSYRSVFANDVGLTLVAPALRTLPALLAPVVQALLLSTEEGKETRSSKLGAALLEVLMSSVTKQLLMTSSRNFAEASWSEATYENDDDIEALGQPNLHLIRWLSRLVYQTVWMAMVKRGAETEEGGETTPGTSSSLSLSLIIRLFGAWTMALRSPGLSIKHQACLELTLMLSHVLSILYRWNHSSVKEETTSSSSSKAKQTVVDLLKDLLALLPAPRLRNAAASRLGMENEDAPMYSRFLQSLVELVSFIDEGEVLLKEMLPATALAVAEEKKKPHQQKPKREEGEEGSGTTAVVDQSFSTMATCTRPVLRFVGGGRPGSAHRGSHIYIETGREYVDPPWTAEFWIRREGGDEPLPQALRQESDLMHHPYSQSTASARPGGGRSSFTRGGMRGGGSSSFNFRTPPQQHGGGGDGGPLRAPMPPRGGGGGSTASRSTSIGAPPTLTRTRSQVGDEENEPPSTTGGGEGRGGPFAIMHMAALHALTGEELEDVEEASFASQAFINMLTEGTSPFLTGGGSSGRSQQDVSTGPPPFRDLATSLTEDDEFLLLNAEDIPPVPPAPSRPLAGVALRRTDSPGRRRGLLGHEGGGGGGDLSTPFSQSTCSSRLPPPAPAKGSSSNAHAPSSRGPATQEKSVAATPTTTGTTATINLPSPASTSYIVPPLYLLRSSAYSIKLQAGGRVLASEVAKRLNLSQEGAAAAATPATEEGGSADEGKKPTGSATEGGSDEEEEGDDEKKKEGEGEEEYVPSQALCVSVCSSGDSDRAFDYVLPEQEWTHLAFVARRSPRGGQSEVSLVVDGELVGTVLVKLGLPVQMVGCSDAGEAFSGQLAGFRYWGYDRSPAEIARDMRQEVPKGSDGLLGAWNLMEGRGSFVADMTSTFRACTQRRCQWEVCDDVPRLLPHVAVESSLKEGLLHPSSHVGALKLVEMVGSFEREAIKGVQGPWVRPYREPVIVRFALPDDDEEEEEEGDNSKQQSSKERSIQGVVDWPERRVKAFASGKLVTLSTLKEGGESQLEHKVELEVGEIVEGCPQTHGWLKDSVFRGTLSDAGRELHGSWQVKTRLVRRPALGVGGMRLDPTLTPASTASSSDSSTSSASPSVPTSDVIISDDGIVASRPDLRGSGYGGGGGGSGGGGVVTVEVCQVGPLPPGPSDPRGFGSDLTGESLAIVEDIVDREVNRILDEAIQTDTLSPIALLSSSSGGPDAAGELPEFSSEKGEGGGVEGGNSLVATQQSTFGYTHGKWFWEWLVVCNSSGNIGVGICTSKASYQTPIGRDGEGWAYYSTSEMMHGGEGGEQAGPRGSGSSESFGNGDVVGVELDLEEGTLRFIKNDRDTGLYFTGLRKHPAVRGGSAGFEEKVKRGFRPCAFLGGPGDKLTLVGLKTGHGKRIFDPFDSFQRTEYQGGWKHGLRHGIGVLKYKPLVKGQWRGLWWAGKQHGLQLWCRLDDEGNEIEATSYLFKHDIKVEGTVPAELAKPALAQWEALYKKKNEGGEAASTTTPITSSATTTTEEDFKREVLGTDEEGVKTLLARSKALFVVRVILVTGATVRNGVEIDVAEQTRNVPQGTILEVIQRVVTPEGIPRLQIYDGCWISERLRGARGGPEEPVTEVMKHNPSTALRYRVIRDEGALVRRGPELDSPDVGLVPKGTILKVTERRRVAPGGTMRLKIASPIKWQGWASEKPTLVKPEGDTNGPIGEAEKQRKVLVRSLRAQEKARKEAAEARAKEDAKRMVRANVGGQFKVTSKSFFLMDRRHCSPGIKVADDFLSASLDPSGVAGKAMVLGTRGFRQGIAYWEVRVESANWGSVFIGVAPRSARPGWQGYGFLNYRAVQAYGSETLYGSYFGAGDTIGVLLDMDRGTIAFIKDGEDFNVGRPVVLNMGVAYHYLRRGTREGLPTALYPCFGMKSGGDHLSLRQCKWYYSRGVDRWRQLAHVRQSMQAVRAWWRHVHLGAALSPETVATIYRVYKDWKGRRKLRYPARGGGEVEVDCTRESLIAAAGPVVVEGAPDLDIGMKVTTPYGEGRIVGVARGDVWYALASEGGKVWYWTREDLEVLIATGRVVLASSSSTSSVASVEDVGKEEKRGGKEKSAGAAGGGAVASGEDEGPLSGSFTTILSGQQDRDWTPEMDEALVKLVNSASSRLGLPATHISYHDLETALTTQATGPLNACLSTHGSAPAFVRFAAILWLNQAVSSSAPLTSLGLPPERAVVTTEHDAEAARGLGGVGPPLGVGPSSPLGQTLSGLRGSIFTSAKLALWNEVLRESTTLTVPPADEYERPEELREVVLNRMQARRAITEAENLGSDDRLRLSLFGQLRDHLASWEDRTLRRSFVHMQDAGQPRAFYVKLVGEGVDDHGGPYRAVFETAVGEEPAGPLELLIPCPNARMLLGENRDQFVLNAGLKTRLRLPLFHHLGRLMGVATRHRILVPLSLPALVWRSIAGLPVGRNELQAVDKLMGKALTDGEAAGAGGGGAADWEEMKMMLEEVLMRGNGGSAGTAGGGRPLRLRDGLEMDKEKKMLVRMAEQALLKEGADSLAAMLEGLSGVLPVELLSLFTTGEVEAIVCGVPTVDISVLQKATEYEGVSPKDRHIHDFWAVLSEMDVEERRDFVNFCSGRSRLPATAADFPMNFKLTAPQPRADDKPDNYLPVAQTCFFSLSLPRYSSKEVLKEKLLYAIRNADLMDADFMMRTAEGWEHIG